MVCVRATIILSKLCHRKQEEIANRINMYKVGSPSSMELPGIDMESIENEEELMEKRRRQAEGIIIHIRFFKNNVFLYNVISLYAYTLRHNIRSPLHIFLFIHIVHIYIIKFHKEL